jgi:hypothetical protein
MMLIFLFIFVLIYGQFNKCLKSHGGGYDAHFGEVKPWIPQFHAKLLKDIFTNFGGERKYTLQFSIDVFITGNMIYNSWETYSFNLLVSYDNARPLSVVTRGTSTAAQVNKLNAVSLDDFK